MNVYEILKCKISNAKIKLNKFKYKNKKNKVIQTTYLDVPFLVLANEDVGALILADGFEKNDIEYLNEVAKSTDIFFDVGSNVGVFSVMLAAKNKGVKVHAFEPVPLNASLLQSSLMLNNINDVMVNQICIGDKEGETSFVIAEDSAYSSMIDTERKAKYKTISSKITTIDNYIRKNNIDCVDIMKIDVEGGEEAVIKGAKNLLNSQHKPRVIMMELYEPNLVKFNASIENIVLILKRYGYSPFVFDANVKVGYNEKYYNVIYNVFFEL